MAPLPAPSASHGFHGMRPKSSPRPLDTAILFWYNTHMMHPTPQQATENLNYDIRWYALGRKVDEVAAKYGMSVPDAEMAIKTENARRHDITPPCRSKATRLDIVVDLLKGLSHAKIAEARRVSESDVATIAQQANDAGVHLPESANAK